jgi:Protein of unknown function (DUF1553)/Protein of unknown function (DUF1549)/Planctomycete cytochrome C
MRSRTGMDDKIGSGAAAGLGLLIVCAAAAFAAEPQSDPVGVDYFESRVRPVLVEHCYKCHSAQSKSLKGGLRLDGMAEMRKGGDTGPAVVPGDIEASLLVKAVRYGDELLRMPPKGKMGEAEIAAIARWVKHGAIGPIPATTPAGKLPPGLDFESARAHWSYQPIRQPEIPATHQRNWPQSPIDSFVLAKLEAAGLTPSLAADRRTLIRRAYYDVAGLPPTAEEIEAFENDRSPDAFDRVVDRLLASPRYGERWGRHWLDVARYADTKDGVLMFDDHRVRPFAYTYRDYVIRAFNEDLGFDRMIQDQLAADVAAPRDQPWRLAAMGFLTLGRMFDNNIHDQIDDKIDTVTRGLLGMTVACARCHDHKYDAIPTADYYSLYGVFASSEAPLELPLIDRPGQNHGGDNFEKKTAPQRAELRKFIDDQYKLLSGAARQRTADYLVRAGTMPADPLETAIFFFSLAPEDLRPQIVSRWRRYLKQRSRPDDPVFGPWHDLMALPDSDFAADASAVVAKWRARASGTKPGQLNPMVAQALSQATLRSKADVARAYGELIRRADEESRSLATPSAASTGSEDPSRRQIHAILADHESPAYFPKSQTYYYMSRGEKDGFGTKLTALDLLAVKAANARPRAMVLFDAEELVDPRIFVRGNPSQPGDRIPRQFLRVLAGADRRPFSQGSGRLDLALAVTSPENPLTARVIVNRVWMHHFGEPLVSTPSDFGTRSTPPSHPELLDYLAASLRREGWSLKALHRSIMLSSAYQQSGFDRPSCRKLDPENRLLWRFPRRRLDLESMRDTLLFVSGRLDSRMLGRPVNVANDPENARRTVSGLVDRQSLPAVFRAFDFASPDQSAERRPRTTVPQQALFSMNAPFVIEQAKALLRRPEVASATTTDARIAALYGAVLARSPDPDEILAAMRFLNPDHPPPAGSGRSQLSPWEQLAQVLLMTNELLFVD